MKLEPDPALPRWGGEGGLTVCHETSKVFTNLFGLIFTTTHKTCLILILQMRRIKAQKG